MKSSMDLGIPFPSDFLRQRIHTHFLHSSCVLQLWVFFFALGISVSVKLIFPFDELTYEVIFTLNSKYVNNF